MNGKQHGFTLIEIAVVTAIIGVLAMIMVPSLMERLKSARLDAEKASLAAFEEDIKRSFQNSDSDYNIDGAVITKDSSGFRSCPIMTDSTYPTTAATGDWFVKLGRLRGIASSGSIGQPVSEDQQKSLFELAYNSYLQPRMLIAGPTAEPGRRQRYLLISVMAPDSKGLVILPRNNNPTDQAAWFDAIWNNNWENEGGALPAYWTNPSTPNYLNTDEQAAWAQGSGGTTNCHCLIVKRIVQPKYTITVNNNDPNNYGWVSIGSLSNYVLTSSAGSGTAPALDELAGTLVIFSYGKLSTHPSGDTEAFRVNISENTAFNLQPQSTP
jgi:prepilin-type N-terminal cleavage/methylation domain-containing protein